MLSKFGNLKSSILAGLLASLCCVGPLIIILLGFGGASTALSIGSRSPYFLALGLLFFSFGFYRYRRRVLCPPEGKRVSVKNQILIFGISFALFFGNYYLISRVFVPILAPTVYRLRLKDLNASPSNEIPPSSIEKVSAQVERQELRQVHLKIDGMWCASCAVGAEYTLKQKEGVLGAKVTLEKNLEGEGWVTYDPQKITLEGIVSTVEPYKAGVLEDKIYE